jgi:hypothetical protein
MRWSRLRPNISEKDREFFERFGEAVIGAVLSGGMQPASSELGRLMSDPSLRSHAGDWLNACRINREMRENRLEYLEWAILVFVGLEVLHDFGSLIAKLIP